MWRNLAMFTRTLLTTVAALALAAPAAVADEAGMPAERQIERSFAPAELTLAQAAQQTEETAEELRQQAEQAAEEVEQKAEQAAEEVEQETEQATEDVPPAEPPAAAAESEVADEAMEQELAEEAEPTPPAEMVFLEVQEETQFLADEEVIGKDVVNVMDEKVGTLADLVMDQDQKLVGVVLSVGGFLGIGSKWVAVSIDQIDFPRDDQPARLLVAVTEEQLKNAPDFVTRDVIAAQEAAEQAQQQMQQQQMPQQTMPPPAAAQ
jgi:hypothetical protein